MKRFIFILIGIMFVTGLIAQSITKELATRVALQYVKKNNIDIIYTSIFSPTGKAPLYLVQLQEGWVLVASEYVTTPVLASAPTGKFPDISDMPDGFKWLMSYYEDAIQFTRDSLQYIPEDVLNTWERATNGQNTISHRNISTLPPSYEIDSIRTFLWNQKKNNSTGSVDCNKVYNKFCPSWYDISCGHTRVGCTAVAMGLVMRYYKWPYSAFIPNTMNDSLGYTSQEKHFVIYNWDLMPGAIYNTTSTENVDEVAGFLRDCGYTSNMQYKYSGSGASFSNAMNALSANFHYENMSHVYRNWYTGDWVSYLQSEIASDRPVIYAGYNDNSGHAFVLYGYTSDNKFIIHWGWGNSSANNGVYSLDSLIPSSHHYNYSQEAICGTTPQYPVCDTLILQQSDVNNERFEIYRGGPVIAQNITINNNQSGVIVSGKAVKLESGFTIEAGAKVYIAVRDMHCDDRGELSFPEEENARRTPQRHEMTNEESATQKIIRDGQLLILRDGKTYTVTGMEIE